MSVASQPRRHSLPRRLLARLGPGFITGAADDDPGGIATYSQVGAAYGYGLSWCVLVTAPLMIAVQETSARLGRGTGMGLGGALRLVMPEWLAAILILMLVIANVINLGADLGAMASCLGLLVGGPESLYALGFAVFCATVEIWLAYKRYVTILKWLTLSLLAYVALLFAVHMPPMEVLAGLRGLSLLEEPGAATALVALLGTTISPYLLFWQAAEEAEDQALESDPRPLRRHPRDAPPHMRRIAIDTVLGMVASAIVATAIMLGTAATLHANGITQIETAADAAAALAPIAGPFAAAVFAAGVIGTGLLAVPILAGSAAFAIGDLFRWRVGLRYLASEARAFYACIATATLLGAAVVFSPLDPVRALYWSAVFNGVACGPLIAGMVLAASSRKVMGSLTIPASLRCLGWLAATVMIVASLWMMAG